MIKSITFWVKSPYFSRMRKFNIGHWAAQPNLPMKTCPCPWLISNYPSIIIRTSWHGSTPKPWSLNPNQKGLPLPCKNPKMPPKANQKKPKKGGGDREFTIFARLHFFRWSCWKSMKLIIPMWPSWSMTNHLAGNPRVVSHIGLLGKIPKATKIVKWISNQIHTYSVKITRLITFPSEFLKISDVVCCSDRQLFTGGIEIGILWKVWSEKQTSALSFYRSKLIMDRLNCSGWVQIVLRVQIVLVGSK